MPSLFSRSRTNSTPKKPSPEVAFDEFGRITSRGSSRSLTPATTKKERKSKDKSRSKQLPTEPESPEFSIPDGYLPLNLNPQRYEPGEEPAQERRQLLDYGYLCYQRHVVLGLEEVAKLVDVVGHELGTRGLTTPFIFSSLALDVSSAAVKRLIDAFLKTCDGRYSAEAERQWREEARLTGPHELGMCLRWGLARIVRIVGSQEVRGLLSYASYIDWSQAEAAFKYPPTYFETFVASLEPILQSLLVSLLGLLTRFIAHSSSSGHTPPTLSPLFGPLFFGLGPSSLAFHHVYVHYLRAVAATEHLLFAFIRWQDAPSAEGSSSTTLGVPARLKAWIKGYPAMLPTINPMERPQPRRGARTTRVVSVRRNVRMYSADLVKTAAGWGQRLRGAPTSSDRSFALSKEWDRICPPTLKLAPRYSDSFRKRMDLATNFHPDVGAGSSSSTLSTAPSLSSSTSTSSTASSLLEDKELGLLLGGRTPEDRFRSLTDWKWGEFEAMGFGDVSDKQKLQFDLTESARAARSAKRATLTWQDFSSTGFSRNDAPLSTTLQFSTPVTKTIDAWPQQSQEIHRKLKKTQKALPSFGWDTEPVVGAEEVIEEAFIDVFCDLIYGGGWLDVERGEEADRECNWALVEFKSLPVTRANMTSGTSDPRTSMTLILFEEFVPLEYRQQLYTSGSTRRRLPSLFGTPSRKQWKPAATLNGRPYVVGHVPHSPSYREVEFEGLIRSNESATKVMTLRPPARAESTKTVTPPQSIGMPPVQAKPNLFLTPVAATDTSMKRISSRTSDSGSTNSRSGTPVQNGNRKSVFRLPMSPTTNRTAGLPPAEHDPVDFEAKTIYGDEPMGHSRGRPSEDAWVDILVASSSRRLDAQAAELQPGSGLRGDRSDPDLASQEVSEVLAAVRNGRVFSDDEDSIMEPVTVESENENGHHQDNLTVGSTSELDHSIAPGSSILDGSSVGDLEREEEEEGQDSVPFRPKRLGYFDLHPDRRPVFNEDSTEVSQASSSTSVPELRIEPSADEPRPSYESEASEYTESQSHDDAPAPPPRAHSPKPRSVSLANGSPAPSLPKSPAAPVPPAPQASKTASLIEMYRAREQASTASPPSKLPVRAGASPQPGASLGLSLADRSRQLNVPAPRSRSPSPSAVSVDSVDESLSQPLSQPYLGLGHADAGLISSASNPIPYVHGAPLHNVLEEEEDEEEEE
ncbi:uncharacterized protein PHACADRAFT_263416 [Phanerochaete carnosa HHB-10118-sp]|uniref:Meiotically up-regulated protein Msb1/Mug8 domain-containing protein n=1 Tax=Phanerochaete carnosa (strain HHB-10118-sp) TaxID=650164 RepID=K5WM54_PHACS|nr:uncharacterized protein PHACADRAFT_263416 [Phanerochaete carnosa HHB-10118-sp]EKM51347.1 hypothetical protein PHACADRAFT_263416 [Phanerochaete carnosa HHB-10118-sp]